MRLAQRQLAAFKGAGRQIEEQVRTVFVNTRSCAVRAYMIIGKQNKHAQASKPQLSLIDKVYIKHLSCVSVFFVKIYVEKHRTNNNSNNNIKIGNTIKLRSLPEYSKLVYILKPAN